MKDKLIVFQSRIYSKRAVVIVRWAGIASYPVVINGINYHLVGHINHKGSVIKELLHKPEQREMLSKAARRTFYGCFTHQALLARYEAMLAGVILHNETQRS